jgi:hypothetical protein
MKPRAKSRAPRRRLWTDLSWPVIGGAVTAVGVSGAIRTLGLPVFLLVYAALSLFAVVTVWGLLLEFDAKRWSAVRIGLYSALTVMALVGLCQLHPQFGLLPAVILGLTSPAAMNAVARIRLGRRPRSIGIRVDDTMLERRFDDIVSRLRESDDFPGS